MNITPIDYINSAIALAALVVSVKSVAITIARDKRIEKIEKERAVPRFAVSVRTFGRFDTGSSASLVATNIGFATATIVSAGFGNRSLMTFKTASVAPGESVEFGFGYGDCDGRPFVTLADGTTFFG